MSQLSTTNLGGFAMPELTIGDRTRDGLLEIADVSRNNIPGPGLRVTVRELIGHNGWNLSNHARESRMRRLAARTIDAPNVRTSIVNRFTYSGCDYVTFFVI